MQSQSTYQSTTIYPIYRMGDIWLTGRDVGRALGFPQPALTIRRIYNSHAEDFSPSMTQVISLVPGSEQQPTRIYSTWGCHTLGMIVDTVRAKHFRRWILTLAEKFKPSEITLPKHMTMTGSMRLCLAALNEANRLIEKDCGSVDYPVEEMSSDKSLAGIAYLQINAAMANIEAAKMSIGAAMAIRDSLESSSDDI